MYNHQPLNFTLVAAAALPEPYLCVQASGTGALGQPLGGMAAAVTNNVVGIAQNAPLANEHLTVTPLGQSRARAGGAVTAWAEITTNASGRVVAAASGDCVIGYAMETAADGDLFKVWVQRMRKTA